MGDVHLEGSNASAEEADEGQYRCVFCFSENRLLFNSCEFVGFLVVRLVVELVGVYLRLCEID